MIQGVLKCNNLDGSTDGKGGVQHQQQQQHQHQQQQRTRTCPVYQFKS